MRRNASSEIAPQRHDTPRRDRDSAVGILRHVVVPVLVAIGLAVACGGKTKDNLGASGDAGAAGNAGAGGTPATRDAGTVPASDCVIAVRTDTCCDNPRAVTRAEVEADLCLETFRPTVFAPECQAAQPPECELVDCDFGPLPSRLVAPDGAGCRFTDECDTDSDCTVAFDYRQCCVQCSSRIVPRELVRTEPCVTEELVPGAAPAGCTPPACPDIPCAPCPPERPEPQCVVDPDPGALKTCVQAI